MDTPSNELLLEKIENLSEKIDDLKAEVKDENSTIKNRLSTFITKDYYKSDIHVTKLIVYGMAGIILTSVIVTLLLSIGLSTS